MDSISFDVVVHEGMDEKADEMFGLFLGDYEVPDECEKTYIEEIYHMHDFRPVILSLYIW